MIIKRNVFIVLGLLVISFAYSQERLSNDAYAQKYSSLAIDKMREYKIPASITLAQGILESGGGSSRLAVRGNNHFGIKCGGKWTGARIYQDDDQRGECFRKYSNVEESYRDHSRFLTDNQRYASLFALDLLDYKGWARGLKAAGYATNPQYPDLLIRLIEENELWKYDREGAVKTVRQADGLIGFLKARNGESKASLQKNNGVKFVVAQKGDTFESISNRTGISVRNLLRYNDLQYTVGIEEGVYVYVKRKKGRSSGSYMYELARGENMHIVSQKFGIRLESLYKLNPAYRNKQPIAGAYLKLR